MPQAHPSAGRDVEVELDSAAFPVLSDAQIDAIAGHGTCKSYRDGEALFAAGERDFRFHVVRRGQVRIVDESGDEPHTVTTHGPGEFTGDVSNLSGNPAVVSAIAHGDCDVCELSADALRRLLKENSGLSDLILGAFIARREILESVGWFTGLRVIGSRFSRETFRVRDFLSRNRLPHTWIDLESDPSVDSLLREFGVGPADTPVVACGSGLLLRNPSTNELAERLGVKKPVEPALYDLAILGAGPAGLAAAVYAASEGLNTVVIERTAPGGQAGTSSKIENYLGFPTGVSGSDLAAAATLQAQKFGASLANATEVHSLCFDGRFPAVRTDSGDRQPPVTARTLLIATGADYRKLDLPDLATYEGNGIYYAATGMEAAACERRDVVVVGGGNSAGQAAVFLATHARTVHLLIRGGDLGKSMSRYLCDRIERTDNIRLHPFSEVAALHGGACLDGIDLRDVRSGEVEPIETPAVFTLIGAVPRTDWLGRLLSCEKGFIVTGVPAARAAEWRGSGTRREPFLLETSRPGVFAAGDVRSGSAKRVASAVGEGSMAVQFIHQYLAGE